MAQRLEFVFGLIDGKELNANGGQKKMNNSTRDQIFVIRVTFFLPYRSGPMHWSALNSKLAQGDRSPLGHPSMREGVTPLVHHLHCPT